MNLLDKDKLEKVINFLDLEKIKINQKVELILYTKKEKIENFDEKLDFLKGMFRNITFIVVEEGDYNAKNIISGTIGVDGTS